MTEGEGPKGVPPQPAAPSMPPPGEPGDPYMAPPPAAPPPPPPPPTYAPPPPPTSAPAPPPQPTYPQQPPPPGYGQPPYGYGAYPPRKSGMGAGLKVFLVLLLLILVVAIGGIVAVASGAVKFSDLQHLLGQGPGVIYVDNLSTSTAVGLEVDQYNGSDQVSAYSDTIEVAGVRSYPGRAPGPWLITFSETDGTSIGSCHLNVAGNGEYTFVVLDTAVLVERTGVTPSDGAELDMNSSSLCSGWGQ